MSEHTAGPWLHDPRNKLYSDAPFVVWTSKGPGYGTVASTNPNHLSYTGHEKSRKAADARLIAAAPELLEALEQTTHVLEQIRPDPRWTAPAANAVLLAREAIAKAKGGDHV